MSEDAIQEEIMERHRSEPRRGYLLFLRNWSEVKVMSIFWFTPPAKFDVNESEQNVRIEIRKCQLTTPFCQVLYRNELGSS